MPTYKVHRFTNHTYFGYPLWCTTASCVSWRCGMASTTGCQDTAPGEWMGYMLQTPSSKATLAILPGTHHQFHLFLGNYTDMTRNRRPSCFSVSVHHLCNSIILMCIINIAMGQYFRVLIPFIHFLQTSIHLTKPALASMDRALRGISSADGSRDRIPIDSQSPVVPCTRRTGGRRLHSRR